MTDRSGIASAAIFDVVWVAETTVNLSFAISPDQDESQTIVAQFTMYLLT